MSKHHKNGKAATHPHLNQLNQGEGDRTSDRSYRDHVQDFLRKADPEALGEKAASELHIDPKTFKDPTHSDRAGSSFAVGILHRVSGYAHRLTERLRPFVPKALVNALAKH